MALNVSRLSALTPRDQVTHACGYLDVRDLRSLACCSKFLNSIAVQDMLWKPLLKDRFNSLTSELKNAKALYRSLSERELNKRRGIFTDQGSFPHKGTGWGIALHKGRVLTVGSSELNNICVKVWDQGPKGYRVSASVNHGDPLADRLVVDEGRCFVGGHEGIGVWNTQTERNIARLPNELGRHQMSITALLPRSKGLVSGCSGGNITIWSDKYTPITTFTPGLGRIMCLAEANNTLFVGFAKGALRLYDLTTFLPSKDSPVHEASHWPVMDLKTFGSKLISSAHNIIIWDINALTITRRMLLEDPLKEVIEQPVRHFLAVDDTDKLKPLLFTCDIHSLIGIWSLNTGALLGKINGYNQPLNYFAFDGTNLVTFDGIEKTVRIRSLAKKEESKESKPKE